MMGMPTGGWNSQLGTVVASKAMGMVTHHNRPGIKCKQLAESHRPGGREITEKSLSRQESAIGDVQSIGACGKCKLVWSFLHSERAVGALGKGSALLAVSSHVELQ